VIRVACEAGDRGEGASVRVAWRGGQRGWRRRRSARWLAALPGAAVRVAWRGGQRGWRRRRSARWLAGLPGAAGSG